MISFVALQELVYAVLPPMYFTLSWPVLGVLVLLAGWSAWEVRQWRRFR